MKKFLFALLLLALIVFSGVLSLKLYKGSSNKMTDLLDTVSEHVTSGNWEGAKSEIENTQKNWDKTEKIWTLLTDHFELDNIEMSLKKSKKYIEAKDMPLALGELENLKFMVEHIYSKELINIQNIL